jgi:glycogen phosphorylase
VNQWPGSRDIERAVETLAARMPPALRPMAALAYNYRWSWAPGGARLFAAIDSYRWSLCGRNPVRLLQEAEPAQLERVARDQALLSRATALLDTLRAELERPAAAGLSPERPVAFFCSEFGIHSSLPIYAGGLGVLAGDILKEASDQSIPMVGMGLMFRYGYFHQRLDPSGWQHEYWVPNDLQRLPAVQVTGEDGRPLQVRMRVWSRPVVLNIWRIDIGRVPLFLLDTERRDNQPIDRWLTARLYDGNRAIRLGQYALLGMGGVNALRELGIEPGVLHLNEGHAALASLELAAAEVAAGGISFDEACARARQRVVFTTHTPVPAGNESYPADQVAAVFPDLPGRLGTSMDALVDLGRVRPGDAGEPMGLTPLAIRMSRHTNAVSRRHGEVARSMWQPLFPGCPTDRIPIEVITNAVHLPTWMSPPIRALLDRHLGPGWHEQATDPAVWSQVDDIPDEELWAARTAARTELIELVRTRSIHDRLQRGEPVDYVQAAAHALDPGRLTLGFARRLASYKRLHLLSFDPSRALALLGGDRPVQLLFAGKAHPMDEGAKRIVQAMFGLKAAERVAERVVFLEDYDMDLAHALVAGCDVWINVPRPPLEASGTSGMKAALNGALNLSSIDGWWAEAYDGVVGWAVDGAPAADDQAKDAHDADVLYRLLESEVVPLFHDRDDDGIPRRWLARIRAAWKALGPRFNAKRMVSEYARAVYGRA